MVSTDYGRGIVPEEAFELILSSCSVPASDYPYTYTSSPTLGTTISPTTSPPAPTASCTGKTYTVKESDTCLSISKDNSVATDRMIDVNHLDYACSSLTIGSKLCIQDTCVLATIEEGQTCDSIVEGRGFSVVQLQSWNP